MGKIVFYSVFLIGALLCSVSSGTAKKTHTAQCVNKRQVTIDSSTLKLTATYKDYKQLVCQACAVTQCADTRLFRGYSKKDDRSRIVFGDLSGLMLKHYGADNKAVSYKCLSQKNVQTAQCQTRQTLKDCLVSLCEQCKSSNCEVYAGSTKVSSGKVTVARGVYKVDTKASTIEQIKKSLDTVKRVATSTKTKGIASAVGAQVINNKEAISKLTKIIGLSDEKAARVDQIIKVGSSFYTKDVNGGLDALSKLTGHPLSENEEREIESEMSANEEVDYEKIIALLKSQSDLVSSDLDLHLDEDQPDPWTQYGLYVTIAVFILFLIGCCVCCVACCMLCVRKNSKNSRCGTARYSVNSNPSSHSYV